MLYNYDYANDIAIIRVRVAVTGIQMRILHRKSIFASEADPADRPGGAAAEQVGLTWACINCVMEMNEIYIELQLSN